MSYLFLVFYISRGFIALFIYLLCTLSVLELRNQCHGFLFCTCLCSIWLYCWSQPCVVQYCTFSDYVQHFRHSRDACWGCRRCPNVLTCHHLLCVVVLASNFCLFYKTPKFAVLLSWNDTQPNTLRLKTKGTPIHPRFTSFSRSLLVHCRSHNALSVVAVCAEIFVQSHQCT